MLVQAAAIAASLPAFVLRDISPSPVHLQVTLVGFAVSDMRPLVASVGGVSVATAVAGVKEVQKIIIAAPSSHYWLGFG